MSIGKKNVNWYSFKKNVVHFLSKNMSIGKKKKKEKVNWFSLKKNAVHFLSKNMSTGTVSRKNLCTFYAREVARIND